MTNIEILTPKKQENLSNQWGPPQKELVGQRIKNVVKRFIIN